MRLKNDPSSWERARFFVKLTDMLWGFRDYCHSPHKSIARRSRGIMNPINPWIVARRLGWLLPRSAVPLAARTTLAFPPYETRPLTTLERLGCTVDGIYFTQTASEDSN